MIDLLSHLYVHGPGWPEAAYFATIFTIFRCNLLATFGVSLLCSKLILSFLFISESVSSIRSQIQNPCRKATYYYVWKSSPANNFLQMLEQLCSYRQDWKHHSLVYLLHAFWIFNSLPSSIISGFPSLDIFLIPPQEPSQYATLRTPQWKKPRKTQDPRAV